ncbi:hypothetical protein GCK72_024046 [Caenorhabditis remanei]|nr:hypothetical protein GCK72_024046 [Caenorhabditis remanei]KAF1747581.1 hypothetical protein GCK72_024046 [Caenorhabditis remanei]
MQRFSFEAPNPPIPYYSTPRTNGAAHSGIDREIFSACHPHTLRTAPLACILKQCAHDKESSQCKMIMVLSALLFFLVFILII